MADVREAAESLLADRPEMEPELRALLDVDDAPWTFDEIPLDSGQFGEVVSHDLVRERGDGYELVDPAALERALDGPDAGAGASDTGSGWSAPDIGRISRRVGDAKVRLVLLAGALVAVLALRSVFAYGTVFREEHVVLPGNDPYLTLYWVEHLNEGAYSVLDPGTWSTFPSNLLDHDLLTHVGMWWLSAALGGREIAGTVLAWYPVLAGLCVAVVLYLWTVRLAADRRVGVGAVALFAVVPAVTNRTMLGYADTEGLDFVWLILIVYAATVLATRADEGWWPSSPLGRAATVVLGVAIAGQIMAWRGGPILLFPLAVYVVAVAFSANRADLTAHPILGPMLVSLAIASFITVGVHLAFGWLQVYRAAAPPLFVAGTLGVIALMTVVRRRNLGLRVTAAALAIAGVVGFVLAWLLFPPFSAGILEFVDYMETYTWGSIIETQSVFSAGRGTIVGPLFSFGFVFFLGLAGLIAATWLVYDRHRPSWLLAVVYGWYTLVLTVVQLRFAGYHAIFNAAFAGLAFVHLLAVVDLARPVQWGTSFRNTATAELRELSFPDRGTTLYVVAIFLAIASLGIVQTPILQSHLTIDNAQYDSAAYVEDYAIDRGLEYPESYVFSHWGRNRMYNYVVHGDSHSYDYARDNFDEFLRSSDPGGWYDRLADRAGFVVTTAGEGYAPTSMHARLHEHYGSGTDDVPALERYRAIYTTGDGERTAFALVPGATVTGTADPGESVVAATTVTLPPADTRFTYEQRIETVDDGRFSFRTPYPGTYEVGDRTVEVTESAVEAGETVALEDEGADG